ncbi:MAG: UDP-N-acetylmuramoyl-L-alanine--D-glutamate ligase [Bulleidia sp.]
MLEQWIQEFEGKNILILGYGIEGKATYRFIRRICPNLHLTIADGGRGKDTAGQETVHTTVIDDQGIDYGAYDLIMKSPGIVLPQGTDTSNISGEAQLFLKHYADRTIGITGTKGKSTTTSLTAAILREKYETVLVGNIGIACFDAIDQMEQGALAAFEISCHQLEYCPYSPHVAVYLNLFEEHLDHYGSFEKYGEAKFNNIAHQKPDDIAIMDEHLTQYIPRVRSRLVLIGKDIDARETTLLLTDGNIDASSSPLIGEHNYRNLAVAAEIGRLYGISDAQIQHAAASFTPLAHRLQDLGEDVNGIRYVNDSISTIGQACIQAMESVKDVDVVLIGGMDRGIEYDELEEYLAEHDVQVVFMYATGRRIAEEMKAKGLYRKGMYETDTLQEAVYKAQALCRQHHVVLLSPAASSYDHFRNFEQRGEVFEQLAFGKDVQ